jgi:ankyrin repeat protein
MGVRSKRKLDEEYLHSIPDGGRRKRSNCGIHASENSIQEGLTFDSYSHGTQIVHHWRCAQNNCTERSSLQVDERFAETSTVTKETLTPTARSSNIIDAVTKQSLIDQLYFDKIDERLMHLTAAQGITCRWFLTKPQYVSWHNAAQHLDHGGFLWIKGNPGTGKSTLMKFLFERTKVDAKGNLSQIILSFFFLARGTVEEKSTTGLYRSLLHQLFEKAPETRDSLEWMTVDGAKVVQRNGWHEEALKQTLSHAVQELGSRSLTIFVDALDECNQHQVADMVCFFEELCGSAREVQVRLQVCFSSRHYPTVIIEKGVEVILEEEVGHTDDIQQYIKSKLRMGKSNQADSLRSEILTKSSGIFLWVILVLDIFNREYPNSTVSVKKMRDRLREIPPELNDLFRMILTRDGENLDQLQVCLKWILFAVRPLKPQELYFAVQFGCNKESSGVWDRDDMGLDEMKTYVRSSSKGLAEVTRNEASEVQFIHESVRDFLLGNYGDQWSKVSDNLAGHSHELLKNCCLAQLINQEVNMPKLLPKASEATKLRSNVKLNFPFLEYAVLNLFHHANEAQRSGIRQEDFLNNVPLQRWIYINNALERYDIRRYTESASLLYIFSEKNLPDLIRIHPQKESYFDVGDERYGTPIFAALANNSREAVMAFLKAQADILPQESPFHGLYQLYCQDRNSKASIGRDFVFSKKKEIFSYLVTHTPEIFLAAFMCSGKADENSVANSGPMLLSYAAEGGHEAIVKLLFAHNGIDINNRDSSDWTPLFHAVDKGHEAIVKLLLAYNGIAINNIDGFNQTPLYYAAERGHEAIVKLLLAHDGIDINIRNVSGRTPLSYAAERGHEAIVKLLLAHDGIDINIRNVSGRTPLSYAAEKGHKAIVQLLLDCNANIELTNAGGRTPLSWAAANGYRAVVKLLLDNNANIESMKADGRTPLSWATQNSNYGVIELLLDYNANIESMDADGRTPLFWATKNGNYGVIELLKSHEQRPL